MVTGLINMFGRWTEPFREEFIKDGVIQSKRFVYSSFRNSYPEFIQTLEENGLADRFREILYCVLTGEDSIPVCPVCGNDLPLRNFVKGFQRTCSSECANSLLHSDDVARKISDTKRRQADEKRDDDSIYRKYNLIRDPEDKNYFIARNYCKHGDIRIYSNVCRKIDEIGRSTFCLECNREIYETYEPTEEDISAFQKTFGEFYSRNHFALKLSWWLQYYPRELKIIRTYYEKYIDTFTETQLCLQEAYYVFRNRMTGRPKCKTEGCDCLVPFFGPSERYGLFCDTHSVGYNNSGKEDELYSYLKGFPIDVRRNVRDVIKGELDFYIPDRKIAIEFNGCWFHSDKFKDKSYHMDKYNQCREQGIQLITIWEDDWTDRNSIVKALLVAKLGFSDIKVGARETVCREVSVADSREFLDAYHLQGYCNARWRYGLYLEGLLVCMLTIGPSRFKKGEDEILRICTRDGYTISGGVSKMFTFFLKKHPNIKRVVSYANCDISTGDVYDKMGFRLESTTLNWSWFYKGKRINRFNKIRNTDLVMYKCYGSGTMKYIYER